MSNWIKGIIYNDNGEIKPNQKSVGSPKPMTKLGLTENELLVISNLVDNGFHEFIFQPETPDYYDPAFEQLLEKISEKNLIDTIDSLVKKRYLLKENIPSSVQCPNCFSSNLKVKYSCSRCASDQVIKNEIIEHPYCGYRDTKNKFLVSGDLVCPKCKSKLTRRDNTENVNDKKYVYTNSYKINGSMFLCEKCNEIINKPEIYFICNDCGTKYNYRNAIYQKSTKYIISKDIFEKIQNRNNINILIIEDTEIEADVLSLLFSESENSSNYSITIAELGLDALETLKENEYDIVIQDLGLPDIEGLELLKEIKKIKPDLKIIVYTGHDDRETAVKAMKLGASEFIIKNTDNIKSLPEIVRNIILNS